MSTSLQIRQALPCDAEAVRSILTEASAWLEQANQPLWRTGELAPDRIAADIASGIVFLAEISGSPAATLMYQLEDPAFWPDTPPAEAAYIHRLAIRRACAGTGLSTTLLAWAVQRTRALDRRYLRLDCEVSRPRLRAMYERFGFLHRDDRQVGPYLVARYEYDRIASPKPKSHPH
jgi:GNAT superfamily N-acetyltransferase